MPVNHYENFPVASWLLPRRLRRPIEAIYAFARSADDFADEGSLPNSTRLAMLNDYERELDLIEKGTRSATPLFIDLANTIDEYRLPMPLFRELLSAFRQDVIKTRYANFDELMDYCRRSADPIGRLLLQLNQQVDADKVWLTNAVKHFKFTPRGKQRLHQSPDRTEVEHCRWWLAMAPRKRR